MKNGILHRLMNTTPKVKPESGTLVPKAARKSAAASENRGASLVDSMWGTADVDPGMNTDEFMAIMRGRD